MPSFDIVSELNLQELDNAINQARKEVATRYDFRGSKATIEYDAKEKIIALLADDEFKMKALWDILLGKAIKRTIDAKSFDVGKCEPGPVGCTKCSVRVKQGISQETAKAIVKHLKDSPLKVQVQIQGEQVRVTGKKKDELQEAIAIVRTKDFGIPLQFGNYRD